MKIKFFAFYAIAIIILIPGCEKEGPEGKRALLDMIAEPEGNNCSSGGIKIVSGIDLNKNNTLDNAEIQSTNYICNGNSGYNSLLNIVPVPVGAFCSAGGYKITSGIDLNNNNTLEENEIQHTEYVCNGDQGIDGNNSLINMTSEAAGENCSSGGYKIVEGIDTNNNGILDSDEIETRYYICNGAYDKEIRISFGLITVPGASQVGEFYSNGNTVFDVTKSILNFNIGNYLDVDSASFSAFLTTSNSNVKCIAELYNLTDKMVIAGSAVSSNSLDVYALASTSTNFINSFPSKPVNIGLRLRPEINGYLVRMTNPVLTLYRK
jgi:hypothetical protein